MSESAPKEADWKAEIEQYFFGDNQEQEQMLAYRERGFVFTNNLCLYIRDDVPELLPGRPNPHDYRYKPFAPVIQRLHDQQPELWERAKLITLQRGAQMSEYWDVMNVHGVKSEEAKAYAAKMEVSQWQAAEIFTEIIEIIAPWLHEAGFRPVELCR